MRAQSQGQQHLLVTGVSHGSESAPNAAQEPSLAEHQLHAPLRRVPGTPPSTAKGGASSSPSSRRESQTGPGQGITEVEPEMPRPVPMGRHSTAPARAAALLSGGPGNILPGPHIALGHVCHKSRDWDLLGCSRRGYPLRTAPCPSPIGVSERSLVPEPAAPSEEAAPQAGLHWAPAAAGRPSPLLAGSGAGTPFPPPSQPFPGSSSCDFPSCRRTPPCQS